MQNDTVRPLNDVFAVARQRHMAGDLRGAEALLRQVLQRDPRHVEALRGLGMICLDTARGEEALTLLRQGASLAPSDALGLQLFGVALSRLGRAEAAVAVYRQALVLAPRDAQTLCNLGNALHELHRDDEAVAPLRQAVALAPGFVDAYAVLGAVLMGLDAPEEALRCQSFVLSRDPRRPDTLRMMGATLQALGRHADAVEAFRRTLLLAPADADAQSGMAKSLAVLGDLAGARAVLEAGLTRQPRRMSDHYTLAHLKTCAEGDAQLTTLEALAAAADDFPVAERIDLHGALAKLYDDLGRYREAFPHMAAANALKRQCVMYDEADECARLTRMAAAFPDAAFEDDADGAATGDTSDVPVFIVGMPRCGSTLVEQILAAHPDVAAAGEAKILPTLAARALAGGDVADVVRRMSAADWQRLGGAYVAALRRGAPLARRITDKRLGNFLYLGVIRKALPRARIVHVRRDPMDTCLSCYVSMLHGEVGFAHDLGELGRFYRAYGTLMAHWRRVLPHGTMVEVSYEDLVGDFETGARRIVEACGLDWHPACLDVAHVDRPVETASLYQVRQPVYAKSVGRWRAYAPWLAPLAAALQGNAAEGTPT